MSDHCPIAGECPFIENLSRRVCNIENERRDYVSMKVLSILVTIFILLIGGLYAFNSMTTKSINDGLSAISTSVAVNSQRMLSIEKQLEQHAKDGPRNHNER